MSNVSLTLNFPSINDAVVFLSSYLSKYPATLESQVIAPLDRPDAGGVSTAEKMAVLSPPAPAFNPFAQGAAVAPAAPTPPAPSTAGAAVPLTAPEAPTSTATVPVPPVPAPPSAPAVDAPAAPAAPASPAGIEVDADGLPWDARIHASGKDGKPKNADGRWRQKRGLNDGALKARVEAELRQAMGAAASVPVPLPPAAPATAAAAPPTITTPTAPVPPAAPVASAPAPAAPSEEQAPQFLARVGGMLAGGTLTQDKLTAALQSAGLSTMAQLIVAPALIPLVRAQIDAPT